MAEHRHSLSTGRYRAVTCFADDPAHPNGPPTPIHAYIEYEGISPFIPDYLVAAISRREAQGWVDPKRVTKRLTENT